MLRVPLDEKGTTQMAKTKLEVHSSEDAASTLDVIDIPYGANRGRRSETQVSLVGGGRHVNFYLSDELIEVARAWPLGAEIRLKRSNEKPDVICFRQATQKAYSMRSRSGTQRPHFVVPVVKIGNVDLFSLKATSVESWIDGEEICIRVSGLF
jgi:hypothetical protein